MKDVFINQQDPFLDHKKWNEMANTNVLFNKILTSMLGDKYKGIYDENKLYDKYDYVWKDDNLYFISNKPADIEFKTKNVKNINNSIIIDGKNIYGISNNNFVQIGENAEIIFDKTSADSFSFSTKNNIVVLKKENRLVKSNGTKTEGLNFLYKTPIKEFKYDGMYLYILSEERIIYGDINSSDNTYYYEIELKNNGLSFDISKEYIAAIDSNKTIYIFNKKDNSVLFEKKIDFLTKDNSVKVKILNDNFLILYDGESIIYDFYINKLNKTIDLIHKHSSEITKNINSLNTVDGYISFVNKDTLYYTDRFSNVLVKADIKNLLMENGIIKPLYLKEGIDFTNGEIQSDSFSVSKMSNISTRLNKGLLLSDPNSSITIKVNDIVQKSLLLSFNSLINKAVNLNISVHLGGLKFETSYSKEAREQSNIKFVINLNSDAPEIFINDKYYDGVYVTEDNPNMEVTINGNYVELDQIVGFSKVLQKDEIDYILHNTISLNIHETTKKTPYSIVKTNSEGNAMIQTGTLSTKGILKISNDSNNPSDDQAFSTLGARSHLDKIQNLEHVIENDISYKNHKHKFSELLEIPISNKVNPGIVKLAEIIDSKDNVAATPAMVKQAYDLANHTHPYLKTSGGTVTGDVNFKNAHISEVHIRDLYATECNITMSNITDLKVNELEASAINSPKINGGSINAKELYINGYRITVG